MATPTETTGGASSVFGTGSENPFGIEHVWQAGDFVTRSLLIALVIMSAVSWWIMITKWWDQRRLRKQSVQAERDFWTAGSVKQAVEKLKGKNNAFKAIAEEGVRANQHHDGRLTDQIDLHEWISTSLQRTLDSINHHLQSGLPMLAAIGSTAPFVGLLGTVWGILNALINIGIAGQFSIDKVAGPVGEALIMTAVGLFVAVPAVFGYNILLRRNKIVFEKLKYFATDMHAYLLSGARVGGAEVKQRPASGGAVTARP